MTERAQKLTTWFKRWSLPLVLFLVVLDAGLFWIADFAVHPQASGWERAVFRRAGDVTYYPYIRALADGNFGEAADYASQGEGQWNFPWLQMAPIALLVKLFGPWGFLAADLLLQVLRWWILYRILLLLRVPREWAMWLGALISVASALALQPAMGLIWSPGAYNFDRITRPLLTDPILLGLGWSLLVVLLQAPGPIHFGALMAASVLAGLTAHGDFHGMFSSGLMFGGCLLWLAWRERHNALKTYPLLLDASLHALLVVGYFVVLALGVSPEVTSRLGVFELAYFRLPTPGEFFVGRQQLYLGGALVILGAAALLARNHLRGPEGRLGRVVLVSVLTAITLACLAPWICLLLTGKLVQVYQFGQRLGAICFYGVCLALCALAAAALERRGQALRPVWLLVPATGLLLCLGLVVPDALAAARRPFHAWLGAYPGDKTVTHRQDFRELETLLREPRFADLQTLATLDISVYAWWIAARRGAAYTVDPFSSNLPDSMVEERLLRFLNLCGARDSSILTGNTPVLFYFHSCGKYQFSPAHTFLEYKDLSMEERWYLRKIHFTAAWSIIVPAPELLRIETRRRELALQPWTSAGEVPIDLIVLNTLFDAHLGEPDPALFENVLRNASFHVYVKRQSPPK